MENQIESRFIALETKLAYLEDFTQKLQEVVLENQKMLDVLRQENRILSERIKDLSENQEIPNRRPPHY